MPRLLQSMVVDVYEVNTGVYVRSPSGKPALRDNPTLICKYSLIQVQLNLSGDS